MEEALIFGNGGEAAFGGFGWVRLGRGCGRDGLLRCARNDGWGGGLMMGVSSLTDPKGLKA